MGHCDFDEFAYPGYEKRRFFGLLPAKDWADITPEQLYEMRRKFIRVAWGYCRNRDEEDALLAIL